MQFEPTVCLGLQGRRICFSAAVSVALERVPYSSWQIMHSWGLSVGTVFEGFRSWERNCLLFMMRVCWVLEIGGMKSSRDSTYSTLPVYHYKGSLYSNGCTFFFHPGLCLGLSVCVVPLSVRALCLCIITTSKTTSVHTTRTTPIGQRELLEMFVQPMRQYVYEEQS